MGLNDVDETDTIFKAVNFRSRGQGSMDQFFSSLVFSFIEIKGLPHTPDADDALNLKDSPRRKKGGWPYFYIF